VKLLLDENLSPRLVQRLHSLFPQLTHVRDFVAQPQLGWPPKIIHLEQCDFPFRVIEDALRRSAVRISEFERNSETGLLSVRIAASRDE
jgi:predicted nuclease of predicted toxin-antitoxin system